MDLLQTGVKKLYFKYLAASFGSALIASVYGLVDTAMVGQYQGPEGTAALAVVAPVWNIIYSLGLLTGIGGSVIFSTLRGQGLSNKENEQEYFSLAVIMSAVLSCICWIGLIFFDRQLLIFFGAEETLLPLAREYLLPIKFAVPSFLFSQLLSAFLRNDGAPELATKAVLTAGIFNVAGDYVFIFLFDMGIMGAGIATAIGNVISVAIMLSHFFSKNNTLKFIMPTKIAAKCKTICSIGFATFFIDIAMGILTILFNRQIVRYLGTDALAVYGIVVNVSTFVQACAYGTGQAAQPIISVNYGAGQSGRICQTLKYALLSAGSFGLLWTVLVMVFPNMFVYLFMSPTKEVLSIAPAIIRCYGISFLLLPFNVFSTYYFQAIMKPAASFIVSVGRGMVISGCLILLLPVLWHPDSVWLAMPVTEVVIGVFVLVSMIHFTKRLPDAAR